MKKKKKYYNRFLAILLSCACSISNVSMASKADTLTETAVEAGIHALAETGTPAQTSASAETITETKTDAPAETGTPAQTDASAETITETEKGELTETSTPTQTTTTSSGTTAATGSSTTPTSSGITTTGSSITTTSSGIAATGSGITTTGSALDGITGLPLPGDNLLPGSGSGTMFPGNLDEEIDLDQIGLQSSDIKLSFQQKGKKIKLRWNAVLNISCYKVYTVQENTKNVTQTTKDTKATIKLQAGVSYKIMVVAVDDKEKAIAKSEKFSMYIPKKATNISTCAMGKKQVLLTWDAPERSQKFIIYRKEAGKNRYKKIAQRTKSRYIDKTIKDKKVYRYRIVAVSDTEHSSLVGTGAVKKFENKKIVALNHQKYSYEEMTKDIKSLKKKYHGLVDYKIIGTSEDGRNIYDVVLGNKNAKNTLLVVSTLHAREYMASILCMNQIEYYLQNYKKKIDGKNVKDVLKQTAIHYIPMANPDGVAISQSGIRSIRNANLRQKLYKISSGGTTDWKANARGVDLNRNFPYRFHKSGSAGKEGYSGSSASSESETRAVLSLVENLQGEGTLQGVINYHAMGSIVFGSCPSKNSAKKTTSAMYRLARSITGYSSAAGYSYSSKYGAAGNLREYLVYKKKIPSITLEIGRGSCPGSISEFPSIWNRNYSLVFREAALFCTGN